MTSAISSDAASPSSVDTTIGSVIIDAIDTGADVHVIAPEDRRNYAWAEPWLKSLSTEADEAIQVLSQVTDLMDARRLILPPDAPVAPVVVVLHDLPSGPEWADTVHNLRRIASAGHSAGVFLIALTGPQRSTVSASMTAEWAERALELLGPGRESLS